MIDHSMSNLIIITLAVRRLPTSTFRLLIQSVVLLGINVHMAPAYIKITKTFITCPVIVTKAILGIHIRKRLKNQSPCFESRTLSLDDQG